MSLVAVGKAGKGAGGCPPTRTHTSWRARAIPGCRHMSVRVWAPGPLHPFAIPFHFPSISCIDAFSTSSASRPVPAGRFKPMNSKLNNFLLEFGFPRENLASSHHLVSSPRQSRFLVPRSSRISRVVLEIRSRDSKTRWLIRASIQVPARLLSPDLTLIQRLSSRIPPRPRLIAC